MHHFRRLFVPAFAAALFSYSTQAADTLLVNHGDTWRYHKGTNAPQANWRTITDASLNSTWGTGNGGFGYADNVTETNQCQTLLTDMLNRYSTLYVRKSFQVTNTIGGTNLLKLTMDWDDGFIAWLDGALLTNRLVSGAPAEPAFTATASGSHESSRGNSTAQPVESYDLGLVGSRLGVGSHVLAIVGLNQTTNSSDFVLLADLSYGLPPVPVTNTWYASNSPIVVTTNVTVPAGSTLVIQPGTTVQLGTAINITVANGGILLAEGTSNAPIRFTRSGASNWGRLTVNGGVGSPETRLAYARFEFNGGSPCIQVSGGTVFCDHLTFGNTAISYMHLDNASFVIQDCEFPTATAGFELVHGAGDIKSGGHGIFVRNFFGSGIGYNDVVDFTGGNRPGPIIHFIDNVFAGTTDDELDLDGTDAWVEGNIFLHAHKNGSPDTASAVSGGDDSGDRSEITVIGNIMYDCDHAVMAKGGNFYTFINNTVVHQTKIGGTDTDGAVICLADEDFAQAAGMYIEANIIYDAEKLLRFYTNSAVTITNNLMPFTWAGAGGNNSTNNPQLKYIPQLAETYFTNWASAQIVRDWFSLSNTSPAVGTGPNGRDRGGVIPVGASISGEPTGPTNQSNVTLAVGFVRSGSGIPVSSWANGSGYTHYKWRLDGAGAWSAERPINTPIVLSNLASGPHHVEVSGKRDSLLYQDDPLFGSAALVTRSLTWTVGGGLRITRISRTGPDSVEIEFPAKANTGYTIEYRDSLSSGNWQPLVHVDPLPTDHTVTFPDAIPPGTPMRFYRVGTP